LLLRKLGKLEMQLYNMREDLAEKKNFAKAKPEKVKELLALLETQVAEGRSTVGAKQENDAAIELWKDEAKKKVKSKK